MQSDTSYLNLLRERGESIGLLEAQTANTLLEKAVSHLSLIMESSRDVICAIDAQGRFLQVSAASASVWGYAPEALIGRPYMDLVADQDRECTSQVADSIRSGQEVKSFENHYVRPDGSLAPLLWWSIWIEEDQVYYCIARDITEKKKLEAVRKQEWKRINDLFMEAPMSICVLNGADHRIVSTNLLYDKWIGGRSVIGLTVKEAVPELEEKGLLEKLNHVFITGEPYFGQEHLVLEDRAGNGQLTDFYFEFLYQAYRNSEGEIEGVFYFGMDVTDQVQSRKKIEASEASFRQLIEDMPVAVYTCDTAGGIQLYNKAAEELWGGQPQLGLDEWSVGWKAYDQDGQPIKWEDCPMPRTLRTGIPVKGREITLERPDGQRRQVIPHPVPRYDAAGNITGGINILLDLTESKKASEQIRRSETALLASEEKYKRLFYQSPLPKFIYDLQTLQILDVNENAIAHYGYSREEFLCLTAKDMRPEEDIAPFIEALQANVTSTTETFRLGVWNHIKKDGTRIKTEISAHRILYDNRDCLIMDYFDVTEKTLTEQALQESINRWETLARVTYDVIWDLNLKTNELYWGDNFQVLFGHPLIDHASSSQTWTDNLHPEDKQRVTESFSAFLDSQESTWQEEYRFLKANGQYATITDRAILLRDEQGLPYRVVGAMRDVTEAKIAEEKIRAEKAFSEALLEASPVGMVGFNDKGQVMLINNKAQSLFGYSKEEILGAPMAAFLPEERLSDYSGSLTELFANPAERKKWESSQEVLALRKDRSLFPAAVRSSFLHTDKGPIFLTSVRNISKRKLAEAQLKESEKNLSAILSSSQEAIYLLDLKFRLVLLNDRSRDFIKQGFAVDCQPGDDFLALFEPDFSSKLESIYRQVLAGEKWESDRRMQLDGEEVYYHFTYFPVRDKSGTIIGICCTAKDVTYNKKSEEAIKMAHAEKEEYQYRLQAILDYSPQGILIRDLEGRHIFSNKAFLDLFNLDRKKPIYEQLTAFFDDHLAHTEFLATAAQQDPCQLMTKVWEHQVTLPGGQTLDLEITKFPLYDQQKNLFGICTLYKDITEQVQHEQQLVEARENAERAAELQEQFLANMSHELRTPMNGIIGMVNLLLTSSTLPREAQNRLQIIKRSSDTLLSLINDVLDLSKIKAGMLTIDKVNFDFQESVAGTALIFKERARLKGIELAVSTDPFLPRVLVGDPHRLNQILNNLLSNALKFTEQGFVRLEARLQHETQRQVVVAFTVSDSGIGIPADKLHYIFDNFAQASSSISGKYGGTGLGLAITKRLIELQQGQITVSSIAGQGTTFTFHLPYGLPTDNQMVVNAYPQTDAVPVQKDYSGNRALIVEDNKINQAVLASSLKHYGLESLIAEDGRQAIQLLESGEPFDIIFMDLRMPEMNGFEATTYIRQQLRLQTPIIILTASVLRNERERVLAIGASDYVAKPFAMAELARALAQFLPDPGQPQQTRLAAPSPHPMAAAAIDISRVLELEDPEFIRHVFHLFTENMPCYFQELETFLQQDNWQGFVEKTHKIRGSLSSIQLPEIYQLVLTMETKAREQQHLDGIAPMLEKCLLLYTQLLPALQQEVEKQLIALESNL